MVQPLQSARRLGGLTLVTLAAALVPAAASAQQKEPPRAAVTLGFLDSPGYLPFDERLLQSLRVAPGCTISVFARPEGNARMMAVGPDGAIYLTRQREGDVLLMRDRNGDGVAEETRIVASGLPLVHGVAVHDNAIYLIAPTTVWRAAIAADGSLGEPAAIIDDLPDGGQHRARNIAVGPDARLYMTVGSTCNACDETNPENATMLRANLDGSDREIFARGLRHTVGFGWHPDTGELWGWDMQSDWRGNTIPPEEINRIEGGAHYGWPFCFGDRQIDRWLNVAPPDRSRAEFCAASAPAAFTYTAHSSGIGWAFYTGTQFPARYRGDAFVALRGSWNRTPPVGYKVIRVRYEDGRPVRAEDIVSGFLVDPKRRAKILDGERSQGPPPLPGQSYFFARLAGLIVAPDGALLVADDTNGVIYRIAYRDRRSSRAREAQRRRL
jgi:glucose/arabinose dehydrogenase